jgi:surfeit locus 1 family protein
LNAASRKSLVGPTIFALIVFALLIGLGVWQLERKGWKEHLIDDLARKLAADPVELPSSNAWRALDRAHWEFRRVRFAAEFQNCMQALVYTSGSTFRPDVNGPGYWVFTPAHTGHGIVPVDRGFVPLDRKDVADQIAQQPSHSIDIVGVLRWPDSRSWFTPADDPNRNIWFVRDPTVIANQKGWGAVPPFYIEQEAPMPPGGFPVTGKLRPSLPNNHLQYAITWFGLAAVLAGVFAAFVWNRHVDSNHASVQPSD